MKVASTVRGGAVGKGLVNSEQYLAGRLLYSTLQALPRAADRSIRLL
jgi:hypothetical protein